MPGIQPYRSLQSASTASNMAANQGLTNSASAGSAVAGNLAVSVNPPSNVANRMLPYSTVKMDYYYPRLKIGGVEPVVVTQVLDPHHVFCRLRSLSHEVDRLLESMFLYYEVQRGYGDQAPFSALGQPCACRGVDGRWYRSLLQELFVEQEMAVVIHVDWGIREIVSMNALRILATEFLRMPVVTFACTMYRVTSDGFPWNPTVITELRSSLLGRDVTAKIECYNSYEHMYGVTLFAEDGMSYNYLLAVRLKALRTKQVPYMSRYPPKQLKVGKFEDAEVEFVIDPSNFWVRLGKHAEDYKKMVDGMTAQYSKNPSLMGVLTNMQLGQLYCARHQDSYYRVEVIPSKENKPVEVFFLDVGMSMMVDWPNIGELPAEYTKLEALANKCCLADTYPIVETWSEEAILAFKVAVADKKLVIHVISRDADEYTIEVMDQSRIEEKNVGKILAKAGLARFEELVSVNSQSTGDKIARVVSVPAVLSATASDYVPKKTTASCPQEEDTEVLDYSPFQEQIYEPGTTIEVLVTHVDNPGKFWCQNARSKSDLSALMAAIQSHCMSTSCPYSSSTYACLAKSSVNGKWYRAFITKFPATISKTSTVEVFYVDYGKHETVPFADLRAINGDFFQLKAQAFKCSLYNIITPRGDNPFLWDGEDTTVFEEFVEKASKWTEFHCIFYATASLDKKQFYIVDLYTPFSGLCDTLVKRGHAKHLHHKALAPCVQLKSYYYSTHDIKCGKELAINVTHVESSSLFYAQLARNTAFDMISSSIKKVVEKTQKTKLPPMSGDLCLAKYSDQQWYRGHIQSENGSKRIFFVDFGNTEKVPEEDLMPIMSSEHDLLLLPMQAIKFSLSDIPFKVSGEIETWFANAVLEKTLKAELVSKDANGKLSVQLYDGTVQINAALKNKLGIRVSKDKSNLAVDKPKTFTQDVSKKPPNNTSNQERKTLFSVGKNGSRESNTRSRSDMGQEPEPHYRKNHDFQYKAETADYKSKSQELGTQRKMETGQRKMETTQRKIETTQSVSSIGSYHGSLGRQDAKPDKNNLPLPQRSFTFAAERQSPAKPHLVTLSDIPNREIFHGMKESVYVSHVNSVFDFYVQVAEDSRLEEVSAILNDKTSSFENFNDEDLNVGNVICAYFPDDGLYYRGVVTGKTKQGLCVEYMDYGNTSVLLDCKNYRLPQKCCSIPPMSIHCSLMKPKNALTATNLQELVTKFSNRTQDVQLDCEFMKQDCHKWDVILKDKLGSINDLLAASEVPVLEENLTEVSKTLTNLRIVNEEETSIGTFTWNLPQPAATVNVYASAVDGPDSFWCQLSTADLDSLASQVQEAGEQSLKNDDFTAALKIGSPCNVRFSEDNNWYRAAVTKMEADLVTVRFIDYGNEDSVGQDQIRKLPERLEKVPPQAFLCSLADLDMKAETWSSESKNYFYEKIAEGMVELTVCEIHESVSCHIPVAFVTIDCDGLKINEEMRKFCQVLPTPDESTGSSPVNIMEADQPCSYKYAPTTDSRSSNLEESARLEEYSCLGDCPLQTAVMEDLVYPGPGEEQERDTDAAEETAASPRDTCVDMAVEDLDPQDIEVFGPYEENDDLADDMPTSTRIPVPREPGGAIGSCPLEIAACHPLSDLTYSLQQELLARNTSESLESLILQFSEKLVLLTEEAISDNAAKEAATTERVIIEDTTIEVETAEEFYDCTKGDDIDDEKPEVFQEVVFESTIVEGPLTNLCQDFVASASEGSVPSEDMGQKDRENPEEGVADDVKLKDLMSHEDVEAKEDLETETATFKEFSCESLPTDDFIDQEPEVFLGVMETYEHDIDYRSDICDHSEDTFLARNTNTKQRDTGRGETKEENESTDVRITLRAATTERVIIEDTTIEVETTEEYYDCIKDDVDHEEPEVFQEVMETYEHDMDCESDVCDRSEDRFPADNTNTEQRDTGDVIDNEEPEVLQEDMETYKHDMDCESDICDHSKDRFPAENTKPKQRDGEEASISFEMFESTIVEGPLTDLCQDFVASASEGSVPSEDLGQKHSENPEKGVADEDVKLRNRMNHEDVEVKEDLETETATFKKVSCESLSTDDIIDQEPEVLQGVMETYEHDIDCESDLCDSSEDTFPAENTNMKQRDTGRGGTKEENESTDVPSEDHLTMNDGVESEKTLESNTAMEVAPFIDVIETSEVLKDNENPPENDPLELEDLVVQEEPVYCKNREVEDHLLREDPVDCKDLEVEGSGIHDKSADCKDRKVEGSGIYDKSADCKDLEVEGSGIHDKSADCKDLEVEGSGIYDKSADCKDLEVDGSGIHDKSADCKDLEVEGSGIDDKSADCKDLAVEDSGIDDKSADCKDLEVEDSGIYAKSADCKDLEVEGSGIHDKSADCKDLAVADCVVYDKSADCKDLSVGDSGIYDKSADCKDLEVEGSGIYAKSADCKDLEVEGSGIYDKSADCKDLAVEDSGIHDKSADCKDLEVEGSGIHDKSADCKDLKVEGSGIDDKSADCKDLEVEGSGIYDKSADCKDLEVEGSGIDDKSADCKDLAVEDSGIYDKSADCKDLEVEGSGIYDKSADCKDLEVEGSGIDDKSADCKDLEVEGSGIDDKSADCKDLAVEDSGIYDKSADCKDLEVEDSGIHDKSADCKDLAVADSVVYDKSADCKDLSVEDSGIDDKSADCKDLEVEDSGIYDKSADCKDLEVEDSGIHDKSADCKDLAVADCVVYDKSADCKDLAVADSVVYDKSADCKDLSVEDSGIDDKSADCKDLEVEDSGIHDKSADYKDLEVEGSGNYDKSADYKDLEVEDRMNFEDVIAKEAVAKDDKQLEDSMNCKEGNEEKEPKDTINQHEEDVTCEVVEIEDVAAFGGIFCKYFSTVGDDEEPEIIQEFAEAVKSESSQQVVEHSWTMTSKDFVQTEEDLLSCGGATTTDFQEVIKEDEGEEAATPEEDSEEASISFEMFESTIVEGPLTDLSQDFVASASEGSVPSEDMGQKDTENPEEGVADDVKLKDLMIHDDVEAKEDIETETATFKEVSCESLPTDDIIEPEVFQGVMETYEYEVDCESDICDHSEDTFPAENTNTEQRDTGRERAVTEVLDTWEPIADDVTSQRDGHCPESFTVYRECPTLIASTDSVYDRELNELSEVTDSDCEGTFGSTDDLHRNYSFGLESAIQAAVESEDEPCDGTLLENVGQANDYDTADRGGRDEPSDGTLLENVGQADNCDTEAADLADRGGRAPEPDVSSSAEAELSLPAGHGEKELL